MNDQPVKNQDSFLPEIFFENFTFNNTKNNNKLQIFSYLELDVEFQIKRIFYLISDFNELEEKSNLTPEWLAEYLRVL